jgi:hypothetical protein
LTPSVSSAAVCSLSVGRMTWATETTKRPRTSSWRRMLYCRDAMEPSGRRDAMSWLTKMLIW